MSSQTLLFQTLLIFLSLSYSSQASSLFTEYIGAEFNGVKFSDVPINPNVDFHFILSFAIDYTTTSNPTPTNGDFNVFWDSTNLTPSSVIAIKQNNSNVKVALSLGGDSVGGNDAYFNASSIDSWVSNAVSSLTKIIDEYNLDGIDIDYEHFSGDSDTFAECIGQLLTTLKKNSVISFASIAPFASDEVQNHYLALWKNYADVIDYVNFQFYAYDEIKSVDRFLSLYQLQMSEYNGGRILASFATDSEAQGGLGPDKGFFEACQELKRQGKLGGIFIWSADDSKKNGFKYEEQCQQLLIAP